MIRSQFGITVLDVIKIQYKTRILFDYVQTCYTVSYIQKGEVLTTSPEGEYVASAGDVMIHRPNEPFNVISQRDGVHYLFNIHAEVGDGADFFKLFPLGKVIRIRDRNEYERKFDELRSLWLQEGDDHRNIQIGSLAFFLLYEIVESTKLGGRQTTRDPAITDRFNEALHYMEARLDQEMTREELAKLYHMNPVYFSRAFQKIYKLTPMQMLRKLRLQHAKQLLESTDYTMEHISRCCGFYDAAHFSKAFHNSFGKGPAEYRKCIKFT
ncbi:helix-turn-helix domain-containing protein [Paenibacillus sp. MBLB2552]|uniref:Helix-turn-helix domain-containing protein n=1 Tax=Paenibacillus mellifer TaxID=2937794 RepID=A0A9X1XXR5_9BACL|nr:helix-turn-helix domain-containing protein [Paenibacillus mellifer]MCK8487945.1 helix-turn-helix domain-containing protein [Paenibacillus mellifer]